MAISDPTVQGDTSVEGSKLNEQKRAERRPMRRLASIGYSFRCAHDHPRRPFPRLNVAEEASYARPDEVDQVCDEDPKLDGVAIEKVDL